MALLTEGITIGSQFWSRTNLDVTTYRNGDIIPQVQNAAQWANLTTGAWCYYGNSTSNGNVYGKLYNWYAINDPRGLAPEGYHIPNDKEWSSLVEYLGGDIVAGGALKEPGKNHWIDPNTGATNSSGFAALPGGYRDNTGAFYNIGYFGNWWSSDEDTTANALRYYLEYNSARAYSNGYSKKSGFSIRCIKDGNNIVQQPYILGLTAETTIYQNEVKCHINENDFNFSQNPTVLSRVPGAASGSLADFVLGIRSTTPTVATTGNSYDQVVSTGTITLGGTNTGLSGDDNTVAGIPIGFNFEFYGVTYSTCNLSSNGNLQFATNDYDYNNGYSLPYVPTFGPTIFALWSDLVLNTGYRADAGVYTQTIGSPGSRIFTAEWKANFYDDVYQANFQIRLYEGTNVIELVYGTMTNPDQNYIAIGIQDGGSKFIDYYQDSNNYSYPTNGTLIRYSAPVPSTPPLGDYTFTPYATTVGLYNAANELLVVGKLGTPYPIPSNTDMTFIVRWDS